MDHSQAVEVVRQERFHRLWKLVAPCLGVVGEAYLVGGSVVVRARDRVLRYEDFAPDDDPAHLREVEALAAADERLARHLGSECVQAADGAPVEGRTVDIVDAVRAGRTDVAALEERVRELSCAYVRNSPYRPSPEPALVGGIAFWPVGRNASHQFSLGVRDGRLFRRSYGESDFICIGDDEHALYTERISEIHDLDRCSIGHW